MSAVGSEADETSELALPTARVSGSEQRMTVRRIVGDDGDDRLRACGQRAAGEHLGAARHEDQGEGRVGEKRETVFAPSGVDARKERAFSKKRVFLSSSRQAAPRERVRPYLRAQ